MKKTTFLLFIAFILYNMQSIFAQGTISTYSFNSSSLNRNMSYNVYLPPSYNQNSTADYPVLYLLHGLGGRYYDWANNGAANMLNTEIANGAKEMIVIMPDGIDSWYNNNYVQWESYMYNELIPTVENTFRVGTDKEDRAVAGLSMGGWGTTYYWIKYGASTYSSAYSMSGAFTNEGGIDLNSMINSMSTTERQALPPYTMEIGTSDQLYSVNIDWHNFLNSSGIDHTYAERSGTHDWAFWVACFPKAVWFASDNFGDGGTPPQPQTNMYVAGTFNSWSLTSMSSNDETNWSIAGVSISAGAQELKFANTSDWSGDDWGNASGLSGTAQLASGGGSNITFTAPVTGTYTINFNSGTLQYSIVSESSNIPVNGVSVSPASITLNIGGTQQLSASVSPTNATNQSVSWSSSNTNVASVNSNGLVTANNTGNATITVTTQDGGYTATCSVTITDDNQGGEDNMYIAGTFNSWTLTNMNSSDGGINWIISGISISAGAQELKFANTSNWSGDDWGDASGLSGTAQLASGGGPNITFTAPITGNYTINFNVGTLQYSIVSESSNIPVTGVNISPISLSLNVGGTQQLSASVSPSNATNQSVSWSSSNTNVATVTNNGLVTANNSGNATITATTLDGGYTATCNVTVTTSNVPVTGVIVSPTSISLNAGGTQQLSASISPSNATNQSVSWSTDNSSVATVNSSGLVTGIAEGNATITVTTQDGGYTATCSVSVTAGTSLTYYRIRNRWQNTYLYDGGDRAYCADLPGSPGLEYEWILEDIDNGQVEIRNAGTNEYMHIEDQTGYVQCTSRTEGWYSSRWTIEDAGSGFILFRNVWQSTHYIHIENLPGYAQHGTINTGWWSAMWELEAVPKSKIEENEQDTELLINVFPNPAHEYVIFDLSEVNGESVQFNIYSESGQLLKYGTVPAGIMQILDISELNSGLYVVKITNADRLSNFKLMVQ